MSKSIFFKIALTCILIVLAGCSEQHVHAIKEMFALRQKIIKEYKSANVDVALKNFNSIDVSFINTSFNELTKAERERKAHEIARFVKDAYSRIDDINEISISFVIYKKYIIVEYTENLDTFSFKTSAI